VTHPSRDRLDLEPLQRGETHRLWINLSENAMTRPLAVPVLVARGRRPGPVVGVTAAVHGNELNGIPTIHRLFRAIETDELKGTVVAVPVVNVPGYLREQREFSDDYDLNRLFPGAPDGNRSEVFAYRFVDRIVRHFEYLIDLHTASFGRINSLYVRADMTHPVAAEMARLMSPQIIVHNTGADGTLRSAADDLDIPSITVEVGDPQRFQRGLVKHSRIGIQAVLEHLDMLDHDEDPLVEETIECARSHWLYTDSGGVLQVLPGVADRVRKGERIAVQVDMFGDVTREYHAPEDGVVVGKSTNPVAQTGARILHLGIEGRVGPPET
jgi:predicted deacylase